ncbi:hypothetical protein D3C74_473310 [compost metagenome]
MSNVVNVPDVEEVMVNMRENGAVVRKHSVAAGFLYFWNKCRIGEQRLSDNLDKRSTNIFAR